MKSEVLIILSLLMVSILAGCKEQEEKRLLFIDNPTKLCINEVIYYALGHGKVPAYNTDGTLKLCKVEG